MHHLPLRLKDTITPDIAFSSAKRLASLIRRRKIGSVELLEHYLARFEKYNPQLNAIVETRIEKAREQARAADQALARSERWGPLHGVPMTVKDSFDVKGLATTWGVPTQKNNIATADALSVRRLTEAGAVIFGKTNVPMWLADCQSFNSIYGRTQNPWNLDHSPGGSSGGSAAALAAGLTGLEMGSDIAGSIRNPAAFCGLYGHKPTMGICATQGHTLDKNLAPIDMLVIGPLARSAGDLAIALKIISGFDEIDSQGLQISLPRPRKKRLDEYKISIIVDDETVPLAREVCLLQERLADFLKHTCVQVDIGARPDFDVAETHRVFDILLRATTSGRQTDGEFVENVAARDALSAADDSKWARMLRGVTLSHRDWSALNETRHRFRWKWHEFFQQYDLLLMPTAFSSAFKHNTTPPYERSLPIDNTMQPFMNQTSIIGPANYSYLPTTVAPIGFTDDMLPLGVQIVGPQYGDRTCIHFAGLLDKYYQGFTPPPGY